MNITFKLFTIDWTAVSSILSFISLIAVFATLVEMKTQSLSLIKLHLVFYMLIIKN